MADYSTIKGFTVQTLASDPYVSIAASGTWASGGALNAARTNITGMGTQTAAITGGGTPPVGMPAIGTFSETYNGTAWTEVNNINTARSNIGSDGIGTQGAAQIQGGYNQPPATTYNLCEEYDGTSWAETADMNTPRYVLTSGGTQTAGMAMGGTDTPGATHYDVTETWNGTSWTEVGDLNLGRQYLAGGGPSTAALIFSGGPGPAVAGSPTATESWNGSSWATVNILNTGRTSASGIVGPSASTFALVVGGQTPPVIAQTEAWDGSTWSEVGDLATARAQAAGNSAASTTAGLVAGGQPGYLSACEEWTTASPPVSVAQEGQVWYNSSSNVLKSFGKQGTAVWSSGGNLNTTRNNNMGTGATSATMLTFGGKTTEPSPTPNVTTFTESYDGSTWTEVANLNQKRWSGASFGSQTSAICASGADTPPPTYVVDRAESWNGTSWTEVNNLNTDRSYFAGAGTANTAGIVFAGYTGPTRIDNAETYDGTSWTEVADLNTTRSSLAGSNQGSSTAALAFGGYKLSPSAVGDEVESWNGTAWTEVADLNTARSNLCGAGTSTSALAGSGYTTTPVAIAESWDGTSWTEVADLATARSDAGGGGIAASAAIVGGYGAAALNTMETYAGAPAIKTFTAS